MTLGTAPPRTAIARERSAADSSALISVIIPCFNRADLCRRAVRSVLRQTHRALEVVVVDDGSNEQQRLDCGATAEQLTQDSRVRIIRHQRQLGVSAARNTGVSNAAGSSIAFLDSDDEWLPEKLSAQLQFLAAHRQLSFCHCDEVWVRGMRRVNPRKVHRKARGAAFTDCLPMCRISPSAVLMKRAVLDEVGPFDERLSVCEDYALWLRVAAKFEIGFLPERLVIKYGGHQDQLSRSEPAIDRFRIAALCGVLADGSLTSEQEHAALEACLDKIEILALGAEKRGNVLISRSCTALRGHLLQKQFVEATKLSHSLLEVSLRG